MLRVFYATISHFSHFNIQQQQQSLSPKKVGVG
uniref:Uncharacterized protein n=1 Tax=Arundo donax TaxID=35708 RepID=A0A0A9FTD3_ARUDO